MSAAAANGSEEFDAELVVVNREEAASDVTTVTLAPPGRDTLLPEWEPGAHIDLVLGNGLVRQYSLCGDLADRGSWRVGILRDPSSRGGSVWIHDELKAGQTVRVRGPRNHFRLDESPRYLFIAGGIGITPILPMIAAANAANAQWSLVYGGRTRASMAFLEEISGHGDRAEIRPADEFGLLDLDSVLGTPQPDTLVYCCGPGPLLDAVARSCKAWPDGALRVERFAAAEVEDLGDEGSRPIRLELRRSGVTLEVPGDTSILEAVTEAGIDVLSSCEDGICGTCMTTVLDGVPLHRDSVLSEGERRACTSMLICVSRAESAHLVLDL
ncbi:PDR/VanB family oxidoreductase [Nocardia neocaledoniensis]|uniref:PDR/VanB family oxidoreductase n=1 Tax=Nocardia neocaledoniensis TaxID=236511 RepID=UPI0024585DAD|nr:PDR/VanB family oxidoreductase [Nocardia neocaledoniensis]